MPKCWKLENFMASEGREIGVVVLGFNLVRLVLAKQVLALVKNTVQAQSHGFSLTISVVLLCSHCCTAKEVLKLWG